MGGHHLPQAQACGGDAVTVPTDQLTAAISVAPMMDVTDRHFRYVFRGVTSRALLYTEMITAQAAVRGDTRRLLARSPDEGAVVLQLGGDSPDLLGAAAELGAAYGYAELNLNVGCPSPRVQSGNFGACLMADPELVGRCVRAMAEASGLPVGVKHRIGIDEADSFDHMLEFVDRVLEAVGGAVSRFVVHARKAWLSGLSPRENRTIPPLRHELVYRLKSKRPWLRIETNGGVSDLDEAVGHLLHVDGVMLGRAVWADPLVLVGADALMDGTEGSVAPLGPTQRLAAGLTVARRVVPYLADEVAGGTSVTAVTRHLVPLFSGLPGARAWRRELTEGGRSVGASAERAVELLSTALDRIISANASTPEPGATLERVEQFPADDQVLDLVGALTDPG